MLRRLSGFLVLGAFAACSGSGEQDDVIADPGSDCPGME